MALTSSSFRTSFTERVYITATRRRFYLSARLVELPE